MRTHDPIIKALFGLDAKLKEMGKARHDQRNSAVRLSSFGEISGMGSIVTYGFGSGGAEADSDAAADSAAAYGRQPFGPLSLLRLAGLAKLTRDECARGLHSLQNRGILEYHLSEPSVYLTLTGDVPTTTTTSGDDVQFTQALWDLSERITVRINEITGRASERTLDMWKIGTTVAAHGGSQQNQEHISALMCHYMESSSSLSCSSSPTSSSSSSTSSAAQPKKGESKVSTVMLNSDDALLMKIDEEAKGNKNESEFGGLLAAFLGASVPLLRLPLERSQSQSRAVGIGESDGEGSSEADKEMRRLQQDVCALTLDSRLQDLLMHLRIRAETVCSNFDSDDMNALLEMGSRDMTAMYITKLLHGLSSPLLPATSWRDHHMWGRYSRVHFDDVLFVTREQLAAETLPDL